MYIKFDGLLTCTVTRQHMCVLKGAHLTMHGVCPLHNSDDRRSEGQRAGPASPRQRWTRGPAGEHSHSVSLMTGGLPGQTPEKGQSVWMVETQFSSHNGLLRGNSISESNPMTLIYVTPILETVETAEVGKTCRSCVKNGLLANGNLILIFSILF